jgi:serine/threonine-protein kinase
MYYNGTRVFLVAFLVSLVTSIIVCAVFFFVLPRVQSARILVPDLIGSTPDQARAIVESRGLLLVVGGEEENSAVPVNVVCRQTPLPGSVVGTKSSVTVFISKGSGQISVPDLREAGLSEATVMLSELGLKIGEVKSQEHETIEKDKIISTIPEPGTRVERGDAVTVILSRGTERIAVPRLIGKSLASAKRIVEDSGFVVGNISYKVSTEFNVGIIMQQYPTPGVKLTKGSNVDLVVATVLE